MVNIWVRNINTDDIKEVGSLNFGSDDWQNAYSEMINRGYKFQIGFPAGLPPQYYKEHYGLYLVNPLDINISKSTYKVVNELNEKIKKIQDFANAKKSAENQTNPLITCFESLERAYDNFIKESKVSSPDDLKIILEMVRGSISLTNEVKQDVVNKIYELSGISPLRKAKKR